MDVQALPSLRVDSRYYNGGLNKRWCCHLLADEPDRYVLVRANGSPLWSAKGEFWTPPGPTIEIYPRTEWFNIFYGSLPAGDVHPYYINIAMPPVMRDGVLSYVDLDLDIGVNRDLTYVIYDEDEFLEHCDLWRYPPEVCDRAHSTLDALIEKLDMGGPLFSEAERYWPLVPRHFIDTTLAAAFPSQEMN